MKPSLLIIGLILATSVPVVRADAQDLWGERKEPSPYARELKEASAKVIVLPQGSTVDVSMEDDRIVNWLISASDDTLIEQLTGQGLIEGDDRIAQLTQWSRQLAEQLLRTTEETAAKFDPEFNPQTDFVLHVFGPRIAKQQSPDGQVAHKSATYDFYASFRGDRMTYLSRGHSDYVEDRVPCDDPARLAENTLAVEIAPSKSVWGFRDPIEGSVTFRNTGTKRIPLHRLAPEWVQVVDAAGHSAESFMMRGHIEYGTPDWRYKFLKPGEEWSAPFTIHTDPRANLVWGFIVPPGRWTLSLKNLLEEYNIPTTTRSVEIDVRAAEGEYVGPRIVHIRPAGDRVLVLREDGELSIIDTTTGDVLGRQRVSDRMERTEWIVGKSTTSLDGRMLAFADWKDKTEAVRVLPMFGAEIAAPWISLPQEVIEHGGALVAKRFLPNSNSLLFASPFRICEFDLDTGQLLRTTSTPEIMWPNVSVDGEFLVDVSGSSMHVVLSRGKDRYTINVYKRSDASKVCSTEVTGHGAFPAVYCGLRGAYFTDEFTKGVLYQEYRDGPIQHFATDQVEVAAESPDGRLVVFTSPSMVLHGCSMYTGAINVETWDVAERRKLYEIKTGQQLRPMFLSNQAKLICAIQETQHEARWIREQVRIYNAITGELLSELDVTPH